MTGATLRLARERLGLSHGALAVRVGASRQTIHTWERSEHVPRGDIPRLEWAFWTLEREVVLAGSGLPECPFEAEWNTWAEPDGSALWTHRETCALCRERQAFAAARLPRRPPYPARGWLFRHLSHLRGWVSAAAHGAAGALLALGAVVLFVVFRVMGLEPGTDYDPTLRVWLAFPPAILLAGAVAGIVWHASRHDRVTRRDEVRTGVMSASAGVLVLATLLLLAARMAGLRMEPASQTALSLAAVLLAGVAGVVLGPAVRAERAMRVAAEVGRGFPRRRVEAMCLGASVVVAGVMLAAGGRVHWIPREVDDLRAQAMREGDTYLVSRLDEVRASPGDPIAHYLAGDALMDRRRWREAEASFERALRLDDVYIEASNNLEVVRGRIREEDFAAAAAREARDQSTDPAEYDHVMALLLFENGYYGPSRGHARKAAAAPSARPRHWLTLARIARGTGHEDEARQALERVRAIDPGLLAMERAELKKIQGRVEEFVMCWNVKC